MFYTYAHYKPNTNEIFYIGKGTGARSHSKAGRNKFWHIVAEKYGYDVVILQTWITEQAAFDHEKQLVKYYKSIKHAYCNFTDGGEGGTGSKTESHKIKIGLAHLGRKREKFSKEWVEKISTSLKGNRRNANPIMFNDVEFESQKALADFLGLRKTTITYRLKTNPAKWGLKVKE